LSAARLDSPTQLTGHSKDRSSSNTSASARLQNGQQTDEQKVQSVEAAIAHIEQVKLMILGMDQRLESRETEISTNIKRAQAESTRFEEMRKQVLSTTANS
jgi:hypothetical protein